MLRPFFKILLNTARVYDLPSFIAAIDFIYPFDERYFMVPRVIT